MDIYFLYLKFSLNIKNNIIKNKLYFIDYQLIKTGITIEIRKASKIVYSMRNT